MNVATGFAHQMFSTFDISGKVASYRAKLISQREPLCSVSKGKGRGSLAKEERVI